MRAAVLAARCGLVLGVEAGGVGDAGGVCMSVAGWFVGAAVG